MKFRNKVLIMNVLLLSAGLGLVGYLMIRKNFEILQRAGLSRAVVENNLVQSSVEYDLLQVLNSTGYQEKEEQSRAWQMRRELAEIGGRVKGSMMMTDTAFYIYYKSSYEYSSDGGENRIPVRLFYNMRAGEKNYLVCEEEGRKVIYVTSCSLVGEQYLHIISRSDISENYKVLTEQIWYFRLVILVVLAAASLLMLLASRYLTRPLELLNQASSEIARGDYSQRVNVSSQDEVGQLAGQFNRMAQAVSDHIVQLNEMVHSREQFVADFTHEIKTPMTAIIGYADTMRSMELPRQEQILALNYIFSEGKRLENLSGRLFELLYLKRTDIERQPVHISDFIAEIREITEPIMKRGKLSITTDVEDGVIWVNRELFVTVFVNVIDNARKASCPGGEIRILGRRTETEGEGAYEFSVEDDGIGMNEEEVKRMWDEFYMADKSRSRKEGGAGIGMSLVALILSRNGAEWDVESSPGHGTKIRIWIEGGE